jgi:predicted CopG family antitoxin
MTETIEIGDDLKERLERHRGEDESIEELIAELWSIYEAQGAFTQDEP